MKISIKDSIRGCRSCELHQGCTGPVPYRGRRSSILVLGEAPGAQEDEQGKPFVGPAGRKLWEELSRVGIEREEVFACNAVSCFPHGTPTESHLYACRANLYNQVRLCGPNFILALGLTANRSLGNDESMSRLHGTSYPLRWFADREISVFPTYHPAAVLRDRTLTRVFRIDLAAFAEKARDW